jgi:protein-S-isoprenylcysteine O-methyltransferase Ste14
VLPGSVTLAIPYFLLNSGVEPILIRLELFSLVGVASILIGAVILFRCIWDFAVTGHGTVAPVDPPTTLVVRGFYRYVRNPIYVGVLLIVLGEAILLGSVRLVVYMFLLWLFFHLAVVFYEEPTLRENFGAPYDVYLHTVGRWLPKLRGEFHSF